MKNFKKITAYFMIALGFSTITVFVACADDDAATNLDNTLMVMVKTINDADFDSGIENINVNSTVEIIFSHSQLLDDKNLVQNL